MAIWRVMFAGSQLPAAVTLPTDVVFELIEHPLGEIRSTILRPALEHWENARGARPMPSRSDIDPLALKSARGLMAMVDVSGAEARQDFTFRLFGTELSSRVGEDFTGRSVDTIVPKAYGDLLRRSYEKVVERRAPSFDHIAFQYGRHARLYHRLTLPLSNDGETIDRLWLLLEYRREFWNEFLEMIGAGDTRA